MHIGFIGLGQMGRGMAARLIDCGYQLSVWNRTALSAAPFAQRGAAVATQPDQLLHTEIVITMLADDAAVDAVWIKSGLASKMPETALHLNMSSVSLSMGQRLAALHREHGVPYVSAPVFGRPEPAATGQLDIVAAGDESAVKRCVPLFDALGKRWFNAGTDASYANIVKIARNFLLGSIIESLGESFALVEKSGVSAENFLDIITSTSMNAPAYRNYGRMILEKPEQPTFTLNLGLKDVELALRAAEDTGVPMPLASLLREQHQEAIAAGYGEHDWAALGSFIALRAGLK